MLHLRTTVQKKFNKIKSNAGFRWEAKTAPRLRQHQHEGSVCQTFKIEQASSNGKWELICALELKQSYRTRSYIHSIRLFCKGVPVSTIRLLVLMAFNALEMAVPSFRRIWPSSQMTRWGPLNCKMLNLLPGLFIVKWKEHKHFKSRHSNCFTMVSQGLLL